MSEQVERKTRIETHRCSCGRMHQVEIVLKEPFFQWPQTFWTGEPPRIPETPSYMVEHLEARCLIKRGHRIMVHMALMPGQHVRAFGIRPTRHEEIEAEALAYQRR